MGVTSKGFALGDVEPAAELLKSLANPQRLMIVCTLVEGERAVSGLERELGIRQPSLSQHLASLRDAGIIAGRREAKAVFYRISDDRVAHIVETLHAIFCAPRRGGARRPIAAKRRAVDTVDQVRAGKAGADNREAAYFAVVGSDAIRD
jgi:DNA-binding transcriptional ArsR family regulator